MYRNMKVCWTALLCAVLPLIPLASSFEKKCLPIPEVEPKKYFHHTGKSLNVTLDMSDRVTHQLVTWVFYIFIKEVVGYSKVEISREDDNFQVENVINRLTNINTTIPKATINLETWIPPDYDTYATEFVKECGSIAPPGRFGWFIPLELSRAVEKYYNPTGDSDISSLHWPHFRDRNFVKIFDISEQDLDALIHHNYYSKVNSESKEYACNESFCNKSMYIPDQCKFGQPCAVLLSSHVKSTDFVIRHIEEENLHVKVLWLGNNLRKAIADLKMYYKGRSDKSLVILNWTPSDIIINENKFITVSFENCERMNFTRRNDSYGYKYEMHRLVKVAWSKIEKSAKILYEKVRSFKFEADDFEYLMELYEKNHATKDVREIACDWMLARNSTYMKWRQQQETSILYIGGIFPMFSDTYNGAGTSLGALMASMAINNNASILSHYRLQILLTDGKCKADNVMKNFIDFIVEDYYPNLIGVLGPACSDTVEPLAGVSRHYRMVVISYSAEGASFSNREKYPYFFRTIGENKHYKHVYLKLFEHFNWKRVASLTEDGQKYTEYISLMQDDLERNQITFISNKKFPRERETEPMTRYLEDLKSKRARIIIADVVDDVARQVMCEAYKLHMTAVEGYVWFLPIWLNETWYNTDHFNSEMGENVNCSTSEMIKAITGYLSITHAYFAPDDAIMQENKTVGQWKKEYINFVGKRHKMPSDYAGFAYDAVWTYALAVDELERTDPEALADIHSEDTTNKLVKIIEKTDFFGVSGRIKFRGGPSRFSVINIMEWYGGESHTIGHFYPNLTEDKPEILGGQLELNTTAIKWFTPDGTRPDDGALPPTVCPLGGIAELFNVGCQTAVIIVNVIAAVILVVTVCGVCIYMKVKYDKKVQRQKEYMERLGLRYDKNIPSDLEKWEVARENIVMNRKLGEGAFGTVYGGEADIPGHGWVAVAVKTLKIGSATEDRIDFLAEAENMKRFDHKNIIKLLGVVTKEEPVYTLMEFMLYGDLKTFLLARRHLVNKNTEESEEISAKKLTNMALDVARGLSYLAEMKYVHRDIASRNCLVNAQRTVKIGDFGMTRPMNENDYYRFTRRGMLPVRWMSPESLQSGVFTPSSDVWSYGVLLYEIVTFGCFPFQGRTNNQVLEVVKNGYTLEVPKGVKPQLEGLMKSCWLQDPKDRPSSSEIVEFLANNPRLLSPCVDVPLTSIHLEESDQNEVPEEFRRRSTSSIAGSPKKQQVTPNCNGVSFTVRKNPDSLVEESGVCISLESCRPEEPLLGVAKSTSSLIKYVQLQNMKRDSGCQEDDEGFMSNISSNGYLVNSKM